MKSYLLVSLCLLLAACSGEEQKLPVIATRDGSCITIKPSLAKDTVELKVSDLVDSLEIIRLESGNEDAYIRSNSYYVTERHIGFRNSGGTPYKLFERKTGKLVASIGKIGKGPGEYNMIYSSQLDEKAERVYLLPWTSDKLLVYSYSGEFINAIPLVEQVSKGVFRVNAAEGTVAVATIPFKGINTYVAWIQDMNGKLLKGVNAAPSQVESSYDNEIFSMGNTPDFDIFLTSQHRIWHYDTKGNVLKDVASMDLEGRKAYFAFFELPQHFICNIFGGDISAGSIYVSKKTLRGAWYKLNNDMLGGIDGGFFQSGYYILNLEPAILLEKLKPLREKATGKARERIDYILKNVKEDDNNVVILGKLKLPQD